MDHFLNGVGIVLLLIYLLRLQILKYVFWPISLSIIKCLNRKTVFYFNTNKFTNELPKKKPNTIRIASFSDPHNRHQYIHIPDSDILICSGDLTHKSSFYDPLEQLWQFNEFLGGLPHKHKLVIAGNHDKIVESLGIEQTKQLFTNATYLENEKVVVEGLKIFGTPISPKGTSNNSAFQFPKGSDEMKKMVEKIPSDIHILITHGNPEGLKKHKKGCNLLMERILQIKPKYHYFGHHHKGKYHIC